jgi:multidrug efflux pump subunit AcrA (membrane-fusion protein)
VKVKVAVDDPLNRMPLGAPVIGQAAFASRKVVELPWTAAASDAGQLAVWLYDPATGAVALKPVTAESFDNERLVIGEGLSGGERVITAGAKFLYPGEIVAPQEDAK